MTLRLQVRLSPGTIYPWEHPGPLVRIGRNPACELPVSGPHSQPVSWEHACMEVRPEGVFLRDLRSSNGTYLNGRAIKTEVGLRPGDEIGLGQTGPRLEVMAVQSLRVPVARCSTSAAVGSTPMPLAVALKPGAPPSPAPAMAHVRRAVVNNGPSIALPRANEPPRPATRTRLGSTTRLFLKALQSGNRRLWALFAVITVALLALGAIGFAVLLSQNTETAQQLGQAGDRAENAQEEARQAIAEARKGREEALEEARRARQEAFQAREEARLAKEEAARRAQERAHVTGQEVYQRTLRSTAFVAVRLQSGKRGNGSGALVDRRRRLVLTAYHVVDQAAEVSVFFPSYRESKVIADRTYYHHHQAGLLIKGRVVARDARCDLALIQLTAVPEGVPELPLAAASPSPGMTVHTVGNPGASAGLWAYTFGAVRQVAQRKYTFASKQLIDAFVVETQNPINKGDSGGPVVNDQGELVAVNSGGGTNLRDGTLCIDVREVKALLARKRP